MRYLLIGNGFDIHHNLPTRYADVFNMLGFWMNNDGYTNISDLVRAYLESNPNDIIFERYYEE